MQFPGESFILGNEFTVTAEIQPAEGIGEVTVNGAKKTATDNSLFAATSTADRADVAYMRHLQNLDADFSGVQGKTAAMQTKDITCVADYDFDPIENSELQSYDGQNYRISDLNTQKTENAGLFGNFAGTETKAKELVDVCLVNAQVQATQNAGVLVGNGQYLTLSGSEVYWENRSAAATNLRDILGNSTDGLNYKVLSDQFAGGLAGALSNSTIKTSFASSLFNGKTVGGLVGDAQNVTVSASYADAYLQGERSGGLFGDNTSAIANTVSDSYAVGYAELENNSVAAGIGMGNNTITRCYSALLYSGEGTKYALTQSGSCTDAYYLEAQEVQTNTNGAVSVSYDDLTNPTKWSALFGSEHIFAEKSSVASHPYNLQTSLLLDRYNYPGLHDIDHWGDWGARFRNGSLVYYEVYDEGSGNTSYGFSGGGIDLLKNDKPILKDGYAVASDSVNATIDTTLTIVYETQGGTNTLTKEYKNNPAQDQLPVYTVSSAVDEKTHLLPDALLLAAVVNRLMFLFVLGQPLGTTLPQMLLGAVSVSVPLLGLVLLMDKLLGKESMGGGDIKLLFVMGLYASWMQMLLVLFVACLLGLVWAAAAKKQAAIAFGPFLALAFGIVLLFGDGFIAWYQQLLT